MPTQPKKAAKTRKRSTQSGKERAAPSSATVANVTGVGSGAGGTSVSPAQSAPSPSARTAAARGRRLAKKELAEFPPVGRPTSTPTRSSGAVNLGAKGNSTMRSVALDLGTRKIAYCEVRGSAAGGGRKSAWRAGCRVPGAEGSSAMEFDGRQIFAGWNAPPCGGSRGVGRIGLWTGIADAAGSRTGPRGSQLVSQAIRAWSRARSSFISSTKRQSVRVTSPPRSRP